jgi:hypothetical protein
MVAVRQVLHRSPRGAGGGIIPAAAAPPPEQGLSFGTLMTGTNAAGTYSGARAQAEWDIGCRLAMFEVSWNGWESTSGSLNAAYTAARQAQLADLLSRGFEVTMGLGLHYRPSWYNTELAGFSHHMIDNVGQVATDSNMTFSQGVRNRVESFLDMVDGAIDFSTFHAIRMTSGDTLEYDYPNQGAAGYSWWGFDAAAQGGADLADGQDPCPWPGWVNGTTKPGGATNVSVWVDWYLSSLTRSAVWMMDYLTAKGFTGWFDFTMPGSGCRPNAWATVRAGANLPLNHVAAIGAVWQTAAQLLTLTPYRNRIRLMCTSSSKAQTTGFPQLSDLAIPIASSTMNNFSESRWIIRVAKEYGLPSVAENPGYNLGIPSADYENIGPGGMWERIFLTNTVPAMHPVEFYAAHSQNIHASATNTVPLSAYGDRIALTGPPVTPASPAGSSTGRPALRPIFANILAAGSVVSAVRSSAASLAITATLQATVAGASVFNAEGGTLAATLTPANTGASSVTVGASSAATYSDAAVHSGALAYRFTTPAGAETSFMTLPLAAAGITKDAEIPFWVYVGQNPTTNGIRLATLRHAGGTALFLRHLITGRIEMQNAAGVTVATSATNLPTNTWVEIIIRAHVGTSATTGDADVSWYSSTGAFLGALNLTDGNLGTADLVALTLGKSNADTTGNAIALTFDDIRITGPQPAKFSNAAAAAAMSTATTGAIGSSSKASSATRTVTATITAAGSVATVPVPPPANLFWRFRGDDAVGAAGTGVASLSPAPGVSVPALVQATGIYQPLIVDDAANGHRGLLFDGLNDRLEAVGTALDAFRNRGGAIIAAAIIYPTAMANARTLVGFSRGTTNDANRAFLGNRGSTGFVATGGRTLDADAGAFLNSPAQLDARPTPRFLIARFDYANTDLQLYIDGVLVATNSNYQSATATSNTASLAGFIGASILGTTENFGGILLETLSYTTASTTTVAEIQQYLQDTYAPVGSGSTTANRTVTATISATGTVGTSGAMPTADPAGWTREFEEDFVGWNFAEGAITPNASGALVTGPAVATVGPKFTFYPDTWNSTHGTKVYEILPGEPGYVSEANGGPAYWPPVVAKYYPSKTISFGDSCARFRLHSEMIGGVQTFCGAVMKPIVGPSYLFGPYGRWKFRMRYVDVIVDGVNRSAAGDFTGGPDSYIHVVPLTIDSNNWAQYGIPNGEFNWPEHSANRRVRGFYHPASNPNESWEITTATAVSAYEWATFEYIWEPGRVRFLRNDVVCKDTTDRVPSMAHAWLFQFEADWRQPPMSATATVEIDWTVLWSRDA